MVQRACVLFFGLVSAFAFAQDDSTTVTTTQSMKIYNPLVESLPSQEGKCVAITGTTSGLGYWSAVASARKGTSCLILLNRNSSRVAEATANITKEAAPGVHIMNVICDLSSLTSVRQAATEVNQLAVKFGGLDVLALNAGVMNMPDKRTADGLDLTMQTNHAGHFLLTKLVLSSLQMASRSRNEARIVTQSSLARGHNHLFYGGSDPEDKYYVKSPAGSLGGDSGSKERYHQSKLANILFAMALHGKLSKSADYSNIKAIAAAPGFATTDLNVPAWLRNQFVDGLIAVSAPDGSCSLLTGMFAPSAKSGDFYEPAELSRGPPAKIIDGGKVLLPKFPRWVPGSGIHDSDAVNPKLQATMWDATETGIKEKFIIGTLGIVV